MSLFFYKMQEQSGIFRRHAEHTLMQKVYFKYLLMKVKQKISYHAFIKKQTINELFLEAIHKSYN